MASYINAHSERGATAVKTRDLLPHLKAWPEVQTGRYSEVDKEIFGQLR